jgi:hypothetical protein
MLRRCVSTVSKYEGVSRAIWTLLRDAASPLLRMRSESYESAFEDGAAFADEPDA